MTTILILIAVLAGLMLAVYITVEDQFTLTGYFFAACGIVATAIIGATFILFSERIEQLEQTNFEACKDVYTMTGELPPYCDPYVTIVYEELK